MKNALDVQAVFIFKDINRHEDDVEIGNRLQQ
jgi:hypothetical protein